MYVKRLKVLGFFYFFLRGGDVFENEITFYHWQKFCSKLSMITYRLGGLKHINIYLSFVPILNFTKSLIIGKSADRIDKHVGSIFELNR